MFSRNFHGFSKTKVLRTWKTLFTIPLANGCFAFPFICFACFSAQLNFVMMGSMQTQNRCCSTLKSANNSATTTSSPSKMQTRKDDDDDDGLI